MGGFGIREQWLNSGAAVISDDLLVFALPHVFIFPRDALAWPAPFGSPPSWRSATPRRHTWVRCLRPPPPLGGPPSIIFYRSLVCKCFFLTCVWWFATLPNDAGWCYADWALGRHAAHFEWSDKTLCLGHVQEGGQGQETDPSSPDLPSVVLTDHWVATHIIASVSDQPYGRRYSVFSCKSSCISCTLVEPSARWTWAPILETSSWLSTRSPHTSLVFEWSDNRLARPHVWDLESLSVLYFQHLL